MQKEKPFRVLSIDWDYFVEEDPKLDFGQMTSAWEGPTLLWMNTSSM